MKHTSFIALAAAGLLLVSCAAAGHKEAAAPRLSKSAAGFSGRGLNDTMLMESAAAVPTADRKIVRDGYLNIEVPDLSDVEAHVQELVTQSNGWISDTSRYNTSYSVTIKVPAERFDETMNTAGSYGHLLSKSVSSYDITDSWYDTETRLETKRTLQKKLQGYLAEADSLTDLLEIEKQLSQVTSDLEVMEGQMQRMKNQVAYSTIHLTFELPGEYNDGSFWHELKSQFKTFGPNLLKFLAWCGLCLLYLTVFGIPAIAIVALLFWLLFGKIGLLRKLFTHLR
ncbi:MAG: DUF4349 domain-containing protein [Treponemataceae bacterium]|nr:DUF4349 domain-containing protein [Treponemataceae bacterium]